MVLSYILVVLRIFHTENLKQKQPKKIILCTRDNTSQSNLQTTISNNLIWFFIGFCFHTHNSLLVNNLFADTMEQRRTRETRNPRRSFIRGPGNW